MSTQEQYKGAVVVTGASKGIGEAIALLLDKLGYQVFAGVRNIRDGDLLKQQSSPRLTPIFIDVTDSESIKAASENIAMYVRAEGIKGLINNAGIAVAGPLEFLSIDKIREQLETNVIGQMAVTQAFLPLLRQGKGRIINMGSIEGFIAMPFVGPYCASKSALKALTDTLRMELKPSKIYVTLIEPGIIATPLLGKSIANAEECVRNLPLNAYELYSKSIAAARKAANKIVGRAIPAEEVAKTVARALTAKKPKARYKVGSYAKSMGILVRFMPDGLRDWFIVRQMGL